MIPALIGFLSPRIINLASSKQTLIVQTLTIGLKAILRGIKSFPSSHTGCSYINAWRCCRHYPCCGRFVASVLSYNLSKQTMKDKEFGTGIPEGIIGSETANNASEAAHYLHYLY